MNAPTNTLNSLKILAILGSTRQGRYADKPARWILDQLNQAPGIDAELVDLRDWPLPFFDQAVSPAWSPAPPSDALVAAWSAKIAAADGFVVVAPEYNHGYSAVLKKALDWLYREWNHKPVAFVSYGGVGGARAVEQLRQVAVELKMAPTRTAVHVPADVFMATMKAGVPKAAQRYSATPWLKDAAAAIVGGLTWWGHALRSARQRNLAA
jgi:NAD(P)H-dependent FMN reductase